MPVFPVNNRLPETITRQLMNLENQTSAKIRRRLSQGSKRKQMQICRKWCMIYMLLWSVVECFDPLWYNISGRTSPRSYGVTVSQQLFFCGWNGYLTKKKPSAGRYCIRNGYCVFVFRIALFDPDGPFDKGNQVVTYHMCIYFLLDEGAFPAVKIDQCMWILQVTKWSFNTPPEMVKFF